jgi:hypothetical protein
MKIFLAFSNPASIQAEIIYVQNRTSCNFGCS